MMSGSLTREYLEAVSGELPPHWGAREDVTDDLRMHIEAAMEEGASEEEALARLGPPEEVVAALLEDYAPELASLPSRVGAFLVDAGLVWALVIGSVATMMPLSGTAGPILVVLGWVWLGAAAILSLVYFPVMEARLGQTVGKMLMGLHVVREDGHPIGWKEAIIRRLPLFFEVFWLDAVFAPFTERKQRAFDLVAGTIVIRTSDRNAALAWLAAIGLWVVPLLYVAIVNNVI